MNYKDEKCSAEQDSNPHIERNDTVALSFPCRCHDVYPDHDIIDHVHTQFESMSREQFLQMVNHDPE